MIDINLIRTNPELVKTNLIKKFQEHKLPMVDEVLAMDIQVRQTKTLGDNLRAQRNQLSKTIGQLIGQGKKDEAEAVKAQVNSIAEEIKVAEI